MNITLKGELVRKTNYFDETDKKKSWFKSIGQKKEVIIKEKKSGEYINLVCLNDKFPMLEKCSVGTDVKVCVKIKSDILGTDVKVGYKNKLDINGTIISDNHGTIILTNIYLEHIAAVKNKKGISSTH